ncbi:MAG: T9SS type A sorting domain-containing protein [Ignavibacteriaceae bacterium]|jgi:hypothetical protein
MKKVLLLIICFNFVFIHSQEYSVKQLFNLSGNIKNPTFFLNANYFVENFKNGNNLLFELENDSSTDIYISHFDPQQDSFTTPVPLLSNGSFNINSSGKIYQEFSVIIFQTNINGNWDIGYKEYKNGQWDDEIIISDSTGAEGSPSFINYDIFSGKDSLLKILFLKDNSVYLFTKTFTNNQFELIFQGTDSIKFSQPTGIFTTIWTGNANVEGYRISAIMTKNNVKKIVSVFKPLVGQIDTNLAVIDTGRVNNPKFILTNYSDLSLTYEKGNNIYMEDSYKRILPLRDNINGSIFNLSSIFLTRPVFKTLYKKSDFYLQFPYTFVNFHGDSTYIFLDQDYFLHDVFIYTKVKDNYPAAGIAGLNREKYTEIDYILWTDSARGKIQLYGKRYDYALGGVDDGSNLKSLFLYQNYPNPFNPKTTISYEIPKEYYVTIKIYDILGKEITTLVSERKTAGKYLVNFNGSNYPSGVYFYRMQAGNFVSTKKFVLLK